jgi:hypothetical protein
VRAGGCAAIRVVAEGVDVHASFGIGIIAAEVPSNGSLVVLRSLLQGHGALDVGVTAKNCD